MSHHLDSPIARQDIRLDITDLYVFRGETGTVFAINVCHSIFGPIPAPGYHPEGMYEFKIDLNGDAIEELTYRLTFTERDKNGNQTYAVRRLTGEDAINPHSKGTLVAQGTTGEMVKTPTGLRVWAGKAGDPFWIEPDVLHAVGHAFQDGTTINLSGWDPSRAKNLFAGHTVYSMVLEVPDGELLADAGGRHRIGVWAVSTLATDAGGWRSINRVGLPMIHPLFTQFNEELRQSLERRHAQRGPGDARKNRGAINRRRRRCKWNGRRSSRVWRESRRADFVRTFCRTRWVRRRRSGSWSGTAAR